jgi:hypothetical protein
MVGLAVEAPLLFLIYSAAGPPFHPSNETPPAPTTVADTDINFPDVGDWVKHCDCLPKRSRARLGALGDELLDQGFFYIDQLAGDRISRNDLANCLGIGIGLAALIIRYAEDDITHLRAGTFEMKRPEDP